MTDPNQNPTSAASDPQGSAAPAPAPEAAQDNPTTTSTSDAGSGTAAENETPASTEPAATTTEPEAAAPPEPIVVDTTDQAAPTGDVGTVTTAAPPVAPAAAPTPPPPAPAPEVAAPAQGDPGDEQPLQIAEQVIGVTIVPDQGDPIQFTFYPTSKSIFDTVNEVMKHQGGVDLKLLVDAGEKVSISVDGTIVEHGTSALEAGLTDGARVDVMFS